MPEFAAIPTIYRGVRFRSRLEARWAATFDGLAWPWYYEPLDLPGWTPDFILHVPLGEQVSRPFLVDIKPVTKFARLYLVTPKIEHAMSGHWGSYEPLVIALHPLRNGRHFTDWSLPITAVAIGWRGGGDLWALETDLCRGAQLEAAWVEAGNITQWKRPA